MVASSPVVIRLAVNPLSVAYWNWYLVAPVAASQVKVVLACTMASLAGRFKTGAAGAVVSMIRVRVTLQGPATSSALNACTCQYQVPSGLSSEVGV